MALARGPAACMNHQFVTTQAWGGDPQQPDHCPLAQIKYDAFVMSAYHRELIHNQSGTKPNLVNKILATNFGNLCANATKIGSQH